MDHARVDDIDQLLKKAELVDPSGLSYRDFRKQLTPRYGIAWLQIAAGWAALGTLVALHVVLAQRSITLAVAAAPLLAIGVGFVIAYLQLFLHESAHWNLHPNRGTNDLLTDLFVSGPVGMDVARYRPIHWDHHRFLGSPDDTEISYFDPLNVRFLVESLLGIKALRVLRHRASVQAERNDPTTPRTRVVFGYGLLLNGGLLLLLVTRGLWPVALAWALGVVVFFPFFGALRQLLEHRDEYASDDVDYTEVVHGAIHRLFGDGILASTLGGAGFNRHLLHHWDPQLSCTRLRELERFLLTTDAREYLEEHSTTYVATFRRLFRAGTPS